MSLQYYEDYDCHTYYYMCKIKKYVIRIRTEMNTANNVTIVNRFYELRMLNRGPGGA